MIRILDSIAGESIRFNCVESREDLAEVAQFIRDHNALAIDTESTGLNTYHPNWELRTVQIGDDYVSYVIPAKWMEFIAWLMRRDINWIGHNGPHDIRSIDCYLGYETYVECTGETYIPAHHADSRNRQEGGIGHSLKELSCSLIDSHADKWEKTLKAVFKTIEIPIPNAYYKSGKRKGQPKVRKARLAEGWALIDPMHPAYIAYAASDPVLTYRLWKKYQPTVREFYDLYQFDKKVQAACDRLQRRAMLLDVPYTMHLSDEFMRVAEVCIAKAQAYGCGNIQSGVQIAETIHRLGGKLTAQTETGQFKTDNNILRALMNATPIIGLQDFIHQVLLAKQLIKRRESYTEGMLDEVDAHCRIHPSINTLGARTTRMSVSRPPLQQLPTKDREGDTIDEA